MNDETDARDDPDEASPDGLKPLLKALAEARETNVRRAADFENYKRRSLAETEQRSLAKKEAFILELLPAMDNLERALASGKSHDCEQLRQGVAMTLQQMQGLLVRHGITEINCLGQMFDPLRHDAISHRSDSSQASHMILEVFQKGYMSGSKVFRPAKVVVNAQLEA